ncbi:MAG: hypothetical protein Q9170_002701 [Blastenia crenularia]
MPGGRNLLERQDATWDLSNSGNYQFAGCGDEKNRILTQQLTSLYNALIPIIEDANASTANPSAAYTAFFKSKSNAAFVANLLADVTTGVAKRQPRPPISNGNPTFVCLDPSQPEKNFVVNRPDGFVGAIAYFCSNARQPVAAYFNPTPYIILCPGFFDQAAALEAGKGDCPVVNYRLNRFISKPKDDYCTGSSLWNNIQWGLLEEIVHYYLAASDDVVSFIPEAYEINEAWALSANDSLGNAVSYAYYASTVHAQCTAWPRTPQDDDNRILLEADAGITNQTAALQDDQIRAPLGVLNVTDVQFNQNDTTATAGNA